MHGLCHGHERQLARNLQLQPPARGLFPIFGMEIAVHYSLNCVKNEKQSILH